jgi:hypothetical protein
MTKKRIISILVITLTALICSTIVYVLYNMTN